MTELTISASLAAQPSDRLLIHLDDEMRPTQVPFGDLRQRAEVVARSLRHRHGIGPGTRVCVLGRTSVDLITTLFGIWRAGAAVTVVAISRRGDATDLSTTVARRASAAQAGLIVTDAQTAGALTGISSAPVTDFGSLSRLSPGAPPPEPAPQDIALMQFTSGTTAVPRAVAVTHAQVVSNPHALLATGELAPDATYVTWLPLYHDMGIIMLIGAITGGLNTVTMATETFSARPGAWLEAISTYRGNATIAPNFAYGLVGYYLSLGRGNYDLSCLRAAWNGAEPIDAASLGGFMDAATRHGLSKTAMSAAYGLAEATLAVTVGWHNEFHRSVTVDRLALENGRVQEVEPRNSGRTIVECGPPIPDTTVTITDDIGVPLADGQVGSVRVQGPGVVSGYWTPDGSPHPVRILDDHGHLITGDLGFCLDGHLYVCGREKDMIIVGGRNLYPEDFEFTAERIRGVRLGNVMAFSLPDTESMVVVAETGLRDGAAENLARTVRDTLAAELDYTPHEVVLVAPRTLPKTTSGKRQRQLCRDQYQNSALAVRARVLA